MQNARVFQSAIHASRTVVLEKPIRESEFARKLGMHALLGRMSIDRSATAKAIDYSLKRWQAPTHYIDNGKVPISNNWVENRIRPMALGGPTGHSPAVFARASGPRRP